MKLLDLFSGIGGFSYGLEKLGFKTVAFCEMDKYCKLVLQKHWKGVKIYNDVKEITKERLEADGIESPDIITGGFPCQPFSVAGKQKGTSDDRHLWPEMFRIIKAFKPRFVIGENVPGIINIQDGVVFETVCTDLESEGYEVQTFNIPASAVGAPHQRKRIWIIATHSESERLQRSRGQESDRNVNGFQQDKERIKSEIRGESERRSTTFGHENVENSRRTLRQRTSIRETNEDETRKEDANQHQRSSSSSESDVANTISRDVEAGRERQRGIRTESQGQGTSSDVTSSGETSRTEDVANAKGEGTRENNEGLRSRTSRVSGGQEPNGTKEKLANTDSERLEGQRQSSGQFSEKFFTSDNSEGQQRTMDQGWWSVEPNVGRVAHGVPGRVHRLKALGNSIVPKIAEEIGRAIIKAEREE